MNRIAAVVAGLSLAFVGTSATIADTINVPGDYLFITQAIAVASDGDVINIASGTYYQWVLNPGGKAITIQGTLNADGTLATTIDGLQNGSVFEINSGESNATVIKNLVITGGSRNDSDGGGGLFCQFSSPTITGCTFDNNTTSSQGGGMFLYNNSNPTIIDCIFSNNIAENQGGGLSLDSNSVPQIINCTFVNNEATDGGGIFLGGSRDISGLTFIGNSATSTGGAMYANGGTYSNNTFESNTARDGGATGPGGKFINCEFVSNIALESGGACYSADDIEGCTFTSNHATNGGAIFSGSLLVSNSILKSNSAASYGGGIYGSSLQIAECELTNNTSILGGAIYSASSNPANAHSIVDSTICGNSTPQILWDWNDFQGNSIDDLCDGIGQACCLGATTPCLVLPPAECEAFGGVSFDNSYSCGSIECPSSCPGDTNNDGFVGVDDILVVIAEFGVTCP